MARLRDAFGPAELIQATASNNETIASALERAEVAIISGDIDARFLAAPHLRWIHCDSSGLERSARPEIFARGLLVTGAAGRSAPALAQHVLFFALALTYDAPGLVAMKAKHVWRGLPGYEQRASLWGKTIGIIGFGRTGEETAKLAAACGMRVIAYRKRALDLPANVDRLYSADRGDGIDDLLRESDVIVLSVRLTDGTRHLIGRRELGLMKRSAYLINVARGAVVDQVALLAALHDGAIAGAGLDVFEREPIPAMDPIWDAPNVIITPHATPSMPDREARSTDVIVENARRYRAGEPLVNLLYPDDAYTGD